MGVLAEMLIETMGLNIDDPIIIKKSVSTNESYKILQGVWVAGNANDAYLNQFLYSDTDNSVIGWTVDIPKTNLYEICVWSPQSTYFSATTQVTVVSYVSSDTYTLPQNVLFVVSSFIFFSNYFYLSCYFITAKPFNNNYLS